MRRRLIRFAAGGCLLVSATVMGCESADVVAPLDVVDTEAAAALVSPMSFSTGGAFSSLWEPDYGIGLNQDDDDCDQVSLGFTFDFYGVPYTDVWVNANGNLTFNDCNSSFLPSIPQGGDVLAAPLYGDFNPDAGGDVYYNTVGTAPNRRFVATWVIVPEFYNEGSNTFQAQFFEGSNSIQFAYNGLTTDGIQGFSAEQQVGLSSGTGAFINSASGTAIPLLDGTAICYKEDGGTYVETSGHCVAAPPVATASLEPVDGKSLKSKKGFFTVAYACTSDTDPDPATTAKLNGELVENGQVVELKLKSAKSAKSAKSDRSKRSKKSKKSNKSGKPIVLEGPSFELVVGCTDAFGNESSITVEPVFAEKSSKSTGGGTT